MQSLNGQTNISEWPEGMVELGFITEEERKKFCIKLTSKAYECRSGCAASIHEDTDETFDKDDEYDPEFGGPVPPLLEECFGRRDSYGSCTCE